MTKWLFRLIYLIIGLGIIFALFYIFAFQYLQGPLMGNDLPNAFIYVKWLNQYWPKIPLWWPEQGGGASFVYGHQIGSYFIILFLHRVFGFSLIQGMRLLGFFSIYLTAVGIYFFTWYKIKNQTASLLAGLFYLVSDVIWRWLFDMGLYAQSVSFMFVPPLLIFFDLFLVAYKNKNERKKRVFLSLASLFYALLVFTHIISGVMMAIVLPLYAFFYFQTGKGNRQRLWRFWDGIKTSVLVLTLGLFLLAFWIFPYIRYFVEAGRDKVNLAGLHQIPYFKINHFFGFFPNIQEFEMWLVNMNLGVGILFLIGLLIAVFRNKSLLAWGLIAFTFFSVMISPSINFVFMKIFFQYFSRIGARGILVTSIIFPVLAGYACVTLPRFLFPKPIRHFLLRQLTNFLVFITAIGIGLALVYFFRIPGDTKGCGRVLYIGIGPSSELDYCNFMQRFLKGKEKIPPFTLGDEEIKEGKMIKEIVSKVDPGVESRVDITPSLGNIMQQWNVYTHTSQTSLYAYGLSLMRSIWFYEQTLLYGLKKVNPKQIIEVARWFGIQRVILRINSGDVDNLNNYPKESWAEVYKEPKVLALELKEKVNLAEVSSRPTFLVIGEHLLWSYQQIFKLGNQGVFPYEQFFLVEGESRFVDRYSLKELKQFDGLILYSYAFKNRGAAEKLLMDYVSQGGKLWLETGWQYQSADWEREKTASYIPLKNQGWVNLGVVNNYSLNKEIVGDINESLFSPLKWRGNGWGFSSSKNSLKDWAKPVLSAADYPLIVVGQYGQGKVIWSGMNLFAHAYENNNKEEVKFLNALANWLVGETLPQEGQVSYFRSNPDEVVFNLQKPAKWLLFKESYSPYWRAKIKTLDDKVYPLNFYRAGPGWLLIYLPKEYQQEGGVVTINYVQSWAGYLGYAVSFLTFIFIFLYLSGLDKKVWGKVEFVSMEKFFGKIRRWWEKEE